MSQASRWVIRIRTHRLCRKPHLSPIQLARKPCFRFHLSSLSDRIINAPTLPSTGQSSHSPPEYCMCIQYKKPLLLICLSICARLSGQALRCAARTASHFPAVTHS